MLRSFASLALLASLLVTAPLAATTSGCGGIVTTGAGSPGPDAADAPPLEAGPPCSTWTPSAPVVVSTPPIPSLAWLGTLAVVGDGALALWATPGEGTEIQARAIGWDGTPTGPVKSPMFDPSGAPYLPSFSIAGTSGRTASAFSDTATGCS